MPVMGFHSVILKPDSVRRVTPPTTMMPRTKTEEAMSHLPTESEGRIGISPVRFSSSRWLKLGRAECKKRRESSGERGGGTVLVVDGESNEIFLKKVAERGWQLILVRGISRETGSRRKDALKNMSIPKIDHGKQHVDSYYCQMLAISRQLFPALYTRAFSFTSVGRNTNSTASIKTPPTLSEGEKIIYEKLTHKFEPSQLQVQDVSGMTCFFHPGL